MESKAGAKNKTSGLSKIFKKFWPFCVFLTFFKFGGGLHYSVLAPLGEKMFPLWVVGLLIGSTALIQLFLDVPAGYLLDKFGYRKFLKITTLIFLIASLILFFGLSKSIFLLTLLISTFGWLFFGPGVNAYTIIQSTSSFVGRFTSAKEVFSSIGIVLSSVLVVFIVNLDVKIIGLILLIIFFVAYVAISLSPKDKENSHFDKNFRESIKTEENILKKIFLTKAYKTIIRLKPASLLMISVGFSAAVFYSIIWFVVPILIAHSAKNGILGLGLGIFDFSVVILGFFLGRLVDSFDKKILILVGLAIFSICGMFLGLNFGFLFLFLGFLATAGDELAGLSLWAWLYNLNKKHESYGLISGSISLFEDLGWSIGPIIAGFGYNIIGPMATIGLGGFLIFINLVIFYFYIKHPMPEFIKSSFLPNKPGRSRHRQ